VELNSPSENQACENAPGEKSAYLSQGHAGDSRGKAKKIANGGTVTEETLIQKFSELSDRGLGEEKSDKFIELLVEREPYAMDLINHQIRLDEEQAKVLLEKETKILERLKEEKARVLKEMDQVSRTRKAAKEYGAVFPFPSMPVFFDRAE